MPDIDFSSPEHRLANLATLKFFQAYCQVRYHVQRRCDEEFIGAFLDGYMDSLETRIATELGLPHSTLVKTMVSIGEEMCTPKAAKDGAESGEG